MIKYLKWYCWAIIDELDQMPSIDAIGYGEKLARLATAHQKDSDKLIALGFEVHSTDLIMNNAHSKNTLAKEIINYLELK